MINDTLVSALDVVRDLAYVGLYAYGINRVSDYAVNRLRCFGPENLLDRRDLSEIERIEEEEVVLTRGTKDVSGRRRTISGFTGGRPVPTPAPAEPTPTPAPYCLDPEEDWPVTVQQEQTSAGGGAAPRTSR